MARLQLRRAQAQATTTHAHDERPSELLLFTSISAIDGTILVMAAGGAFGSLEGAIVAGLTVIAGAGSWIAAYTQYGDRALARADWMRLCRTATLASALTLAAALVGLFLADHVQGARLETGAAVALLLLAGQLAGLRLPSAGGLPLPMLVVSVTLVWEVTYWIP